MKGVGKGDGWKAVIALAPAGIMLLIFTFFPIFNTIIMSFLEGFTPKSGAGVFAFNNYFDSVGFGVYKQVLTDHYFWDSLKNTLLLVVISVPLTIIIALMMAVALNSIKKLQGLYQTIFFLPYVTNTIALGAVFSAMFGSANTGLINQVIRIFGGAGINWTNISASYWAFGTVIIVYTVWNGLAFKILVFMSGLQSIDKQYYDAAKIDGASKKRILWKITIPLLSPQILYITITSFIGAFKSYTSIISLVGKGAYDYGGQDGRQWITVAGYIYKALETPTAPGAYTKASAGAMILLIIILACTGIQSFVSRKRVHY